MFTVEQAGEIPPCEDKKIMLKFRTMRNLTPLLLALFCACGPHDKPPATEKTPAPLDKKAFEQTLDGKQTTLFFLKNGQSEVAITNFGGRIVGCRVPDKNGKLTDVVAGFKSLNEYLASKEPFYGALIGRYANRIKKAQFTLDGKPVLLSANNGPNQLHGGKTGFHNRVWDARQTNEASLELTYLSKDGEEAYPGNLSVKVLYTLTPENELAIAYTATTDKTTVLNLTAHPFFNLNGEGSGTINDHLLSIPADHYMPIDSNVLVTGSIDKVEGTPFDFRKPVAIGARLNANNEQLAFGKGYDHNFVLNKGISDRPEPAATVEGDKSGIVMQVLTTEPGLQFYGGNFMKGEHTFKYGAKDDFRTTFCLETQHFPDSPNNPQFPTTVLKPGEVYHQLSIYKFSHQ